MTYCVSPDTLPCLPDQQQRRLDSAFIDGDAPRVGESVCSEAGEDVAGRQLDEQPDTELEEQGCGVVPTDRPFDAPGRIGTDPLRVPQRTATDVAQVRDGGRVHGNVGERPLEFGGGRGHEGRMGRYGHGEALGASGTVLASEVQKPLQGVVRTGNANLQGALTLAAWTGAFRVPDSSARRDTVRSQPDDDAHAIAVRVGVLHGTGAQVDQAQRVRVGERAGRHGGGEGAHRVSRHEVRCAAFLDQSPAAVAPSTSRASCVATVEPRASGCSIRARHGRVPRLHV